MNSRDVKSCIAGACTDYTKMFIGLGLQSEMSRKSMDQQILL